jgi:DNA (cytosine-5)-methyltransferase 1
MASMPDPLHTYSTNSDLVVERIRHLPIGGRMKDIPQHLWHDSYVRVGAKKTGGPNLRLLRLDPDLPSNTVTAYIFNKFAHPFEDRYITPREAARLQQFPDDHDFAGAITNIQLQIGNAVPVGLARAVAQHVSQRLRQRTRKRELSAVSLFAGAGGMDLGFQDFFSVKASNEFVPVFSETLRRNFPETEVINADISQLSATDLKPRGGVDLVFGGPPCQPFSAAGKQRGVDDPRGTLVKEYLRIVAELEPKYFVMENVPGLVSNAKGGALRFIKEHAEEIGYATEHFVLTATDYGTPQMRNRLFVIGRRDTSEPELGRPFPTHGTPGTQGDLLLLPCATVGDAFEGLSAARPRKGEPKKVEEVA